MDKSYKEDIPKYRRILQEMRHEFARAGASTDWGSLRIKPLLAHVARLEKMLEAPQFSREATRLRKGVGMFHADLVYLRANIRELKAILEAERRKPGPPKR